MIHIQVSNVKMNDVAKIKVVGKGNKQRVVYAKSELIGNIRREFKSTTHLFETRTGTTFNRRNLLRDIKKAGQQAGFNINPHTLRHSCAMRLKNMGKEADYIQEYLANLFCFL